MPVDDSALESARQALLGLVRPREPSARAIYRLELVLEEALTNIVRHAYPEGGRHWIELTAQLQADALVLTVVDDGEPFDPLRHEPAPRPKSLGEAVPGGLGLAFIRKSVRDARYARTGGRNVLTLHLGLQD